MSRRLVFYKSCFVPNYPLVVLFLGDLFDLVEQLADPELQLRQLLFLGDIGVVDGVLAHLDVQVDSLKIKSRKSVK